jgi:hypothetical protein
VLTAFEREHHLLRLGCLPQWLTLQMGISLPAHQRAQEGIEHVTARVERRACWGAVCAMRVPRVMRVVRAVRVVRVHVF